MAEECKKMGAEILNKCHVTGVLRDGKGKVTGVETSNGTFLTDTVIACAGAWTPEIGRMVGIDIPIIPRKGLILVSERGPKIVHQAVHEYGYMLTVYGDGTYERKVSERVKENDITFQIEPMEAGNFIMGSSHRPFVGLDFKSEIEVMQAVAERGIRFFPIIREINCIRSYCGVRPHTEAHIPFICGVAEVPGFYVCSGHEGDGIAMSGISGKLMAQIIAGEETDFDMAPFDLKRGY